ncbi:hypothetical protein B0T18DRAFT_429350 [Schizothecium vesticola]|uniref:Uncharacterized protein n=1 Tax=Schizothecium vesticola TaxID=314040 RepID=A0AA40EW45_9PEZI|nr:hypothetical protein B0T18DRAFT_429350 [Schizothecium vesticola]
MSGNGYSYKGHGTNNQVGPPTYYNDGAGGLTYTAPSGGSNSQSTGSGSGSSGSGSAQN